MKYRIKATIETEKTGLFGNKKKVLEEKWIEVDEKTYQQLLQEGKIRDEGLSIEDMIILDMFLD